MKCPQCGFKNDIKSRFCSQCGAELLAAADAQSTTALAELYGKEVDVLFFIENFTGKISGIVNPTEDQIGRYREGVLQRVTVESGTNNATDETVGTILTFIRQSKDYLGEEFNETQYRTFAPKELKKEYLKLFERILKVKAQRGEPPKQANAPTVKDPNKK
jgi:hypothetical protein